MMVGTDDAFCELSFSPNVSLIATVRRFVGEFYEKVMKSPSITSRLVIATHELLENAVRYSADGNSRIRIGVTRVGADYRVRIMTQNRTNESDHAALLALVAELNVEGEDRDKVYQRLLARSAKRTSGSGLGLGRIYAESEMNLSCQIEGDTVHLLAEGLFTTEETKA